VFESILDRDRLGRPVRDDFVIVDTAREFVQAPTIAAEVIFATSKSRVRKSVTVFIPSFTSFSPVTLPTPGKRPTGSGRRNASMSSGRMTKSPSGLRQSDASFARNLFGANARGGCEIQFLTNLLADRLGYLGCGWYANIRSQE
jgi:hypothetical protein